MDIAMPGLNGIDATRRIKAVRPRVSVLVLSAYDDDQYVFVEKEGVAEKGDYLLLDFEVLDDEGAALADSKRETSTRLGIT